MGKISVNFGYSGAYTIELVWTQGTQDTSNNTTALHFACTVYSNGGGFTYSGQGRTDTLTVGGVTVHPQHGNYVVPGGGSVLLWESDVTVTHDEDGSYTDKAVSVGILIDTTFSTSGYIGTVTASGTITLDTIPRASSLSYGEITLGQRNTVTIQAASSAFKHRLYLRVGEFTAPMVYDKAGGTYGITPSVDDFAPQITDSDSASGTLLLQTYDASGTMIGYKNEPVNVIVPASAGPNVSTGWATASYDNTETAAAAIATFVQGYSKAKVTFDDNKIETQYGATIQGYEISCAGVTNGASPYLTDVLTGTRASIVCTVTDSRGHTASETLTVTLYPYRSPTLSSLELYRGDEDGTANDEGVCIWAKAALKYSDIDGMNTCSLQGFYRLAGGSYGTGINLASKQAKILTNAALIDSSYVAKIVAQDSLGNSRQYEVTIPTANAAFHIKDGGKAAAFGKYAEEDGLLDVAWRTRLRGAVMFDDPTSAANLLGRGAKTGDFDEMTDAGAYYCDLSQCTNGPGTSGYGILEVIRVDSNANGVRLQRFTVYNSGATYTRTYVNRQWYPWNQP